MQNQRIKLVRPQLAPDGAGGQEKTGETVLFERFATVTDKELKRLTEAGQVLIKRGIEARLYAIEGCMPQAGDVLHFRGSQYALQGPPQMPGFNGRYWVLTGFEV